MAAAGLPPASFDLVWSEGALYNLGIDRALRLCRGLLRRGGYLAFTDAVWRRDDPPAAIRASFESDYPAMGRIEDLLAAIARAGFTLEGHFTLPDEAWWEEFYTPMEARLEELRAIYRTDPEALTLLTQLARDWKATLPAHPDPGCIDKAGREKARKPAAGAKKVRATAGQGK